MACRASGALLCGVGPTPGPLSLGLPPRSSLGLCDALVRSSLQGWRPMVRPRPWGGEHKPYGIRQCRFANMKSGFHPLLGSASNSPRTTGRGSGARGTEAFHQSTKSCACASLRCSVSMRRKWARCAAGTQMKQSATRGLPSNVCVRPFIVPLIAKGKRIAPPAASRSSSRGCSRSTK